MVHISLTSEVLFHIFNFPITNTLIMTWLVMSILIFFSIIVSKNIKKSPGKLQNIVEMVIENMFNFFESVVGSKKQALKFFPITATLFLFILLSNWLEILPGLNAIGITEGEAGEGHILPFIRSPSSDLNFTLGLAIISVALTQIVGIGTIGFFKYFSKFICLKSPLGFFVGVLELISEIAKLISFSFRLFGNIFAGEVLLITIGVLVPIIAPIPFLGLEIFVGIIQALIFSLLTLIFFKVATISD
ncbi:MAG: F0F1 ATP synthase subunit A [Patescibacteria group bacterium]|nr:F0F1 ATP synthase subunit A [Patescibacteria group bacterium]